MATKKDKTRPRRVQVANACIGCRSAKLKCSGEHPVCLRCDDRGLDCLYDVTEGMTKRQQLRLDLSDQRQELDRAMAILHYLREGSDQQATETLARLRIGQSIDAEYQRICGRIEEQDVDSTRPVDQVAVSPRDDKLDPNLNAEVAAPNNRLASPIAAKTQEQMPMDWSYQSRPDAQDWIGFENDSWGSHGMSVVDPQALERSQATYSWPRSSPAANTPGGSSASSLVDGLNLYRQPPHGSQ